ncbi:MAG: metal-dependent transcriptional regulator [Phycisphaeraceae bacterium]|nr:metal-dependent transcriptional regulator [Phycisphaeraceae bacterium]
MPTPTVENYLKALYVQPPAPGQQPTELIPMGQVAEAMRVSPGTATSMMKTLAEAGLVEYEPRAGVRLSERGLALALQILRRHRLIEQFLVQVLGLDWSEVHDEAEELEHAISDKVLERIDLLLGHPDTDPHGDPIPPSHGQPAHVELTPLSLAEVGAQVTVARVLDQQPDFLNFAHQHGLTPGSRLTVLAHQPAADAITCQPEGAPSLTLGTAAAGKILTLIEQTAS